MKKYIIVVGLLAIGVALGICLKPCSKIAVINVNQVVQAHPKLSLVQRENALKNGEFSQWTAAAQKQIEAEKDKDKKAALVKQAQTLAQQKINEIQQEHAQRMKELDTEITSVVSAVAKKNGCNIVFDKKALVSGGLDITDKVLEKFKEEKK